MLIKAGADVNCVDKSNHTVMSRYLQEGTKDSAIVECLMKAGFKE